MGWIPRYAMEAEATLLGKNAMTISDSPDKLGLDARGAPWMPVACTIGMHFPLSTRVTATKGQNHGPDFTVVIALQWSGARYAGD